MAVKNIFATMSDEKLDLYTKISARSRVNYNLEIDIEIPNNIIILNAENKSFGRILTEVGTLLRGKYKPSFTPNVDCGDYVVIINAEKAKFSGVKLDSKKYFTHSGYFGSTKSKKLGDMLENHTEKLFRQAVRGMLPKTLLGRRMLKKLKVYKETITDVDDFQKFISDASKDTNENIQQSSKISIRG